MKLIRKYYKVIFSIIFILVLSTLLVVVQNLTRERIETLNDAETVGLLKTVFAEADSYLLKDTTEEIYVVYDSELNKIGYAFYVNGIGFKDWFKVLVGIKDTGTFSAINIISHNEHQGFGYTEGEKVDFTNFSLQFIDLKIEDCILSKDGGIVDAVTMATLGSRAIVDNIRETALKKASVITEKGY
jgi:Na+-translocating ferredoxin:NAD+ oxidoreductase RnfG subunit